jgi:hypothetical protein
MQKNSEKTKGLPKEKAELRKKKPLAPTWTSQNQKEAYHKIVCTWFWYVQVVRQNLIGCFTKI